jgi:large subunit ribosomal protein L4
MAITTFTATGTKSTTPTKLSKTVFAVEITNHELLKDAYLSYLAAGRDNIAKTLKRGEIRGGGKKPWKQKGTGRARFGSSRNPIWRGGGVVFGPSTNENYTRKLNIKAKHKALSQALTLKAGSGELVVIETFKTKGKVKETVGFLNKIGAKGNILLVVSVLDDLVKMATGNLPNVKAIYAKSLNVFDVLNADTIIVSKKSLDLIEQWLGDKK